MAHSGRLWPVQQNARIFSGQKTWPNFPAKRYLFHCEGWEGSALHPTVFGAVCEFTDIFTGGRASWRSEDLGPAGQVTIVEFSLTIPDQPSELLLFQAQIYVDEVPQMIDPLDWVPLTPFGENAAAGHDGFMVTGWTLAPGGIWGFTAEPWPT